MFDSYLKSKLSAARRQHSMNVADLAVELAERYELNTDAAYQAGLVHDIAREMDEKKLLAIAREQGLVTDPVEILEPILLHGAVGAHLLKQELGLKSENILQAVKFHTTGHAAMNCLDAVIYLADIIEPGRGFPGVETLRRTAYDDLWKAVVEAMNRSIIYVIERQKPLHPLTVKARNQLLTNKCFYDQIQEG